MPLRARAFRASAAATTALLLAACGAAPRPTPAPAPVVTPSAPGLDAPVAALVPVPLTTGVVSAVPGAQRFEHTPGLTWDLDVLPYEGQERVQKYVSYFAGDARPRFTEWLRRGTRYDAMIRAKLRAGGLPEDLTYLALVESGYDVHATSRASAVGMWQFMAETARDAGLRVDWWVDERRDPVRATDAAVRTLRWLKGQFGSFFVAAAAYNGGPGRVSRGIAQLATTDSAAALVAGDARFFALAGGNVLRDETKNYVPQLIAAALVAKEATRYGIAAQPLPPLTYDEVRVPPLTPLAAVAAASGASRAELLDLNPHLLRGLTPPGAALLVRVPDGRGAATAATLAEFGEESRRAFRRAVTRKRETWAALAARLDVSRAVLAAYNAGLQTVRRGKRKGQLVAGQAVRVPTPSVLAYARDVVSDGDGPGALPELPPVPPEPAAADEHPVKRGSAHAVAPTVRHAVSRASRTPRASHARAPRRRAAG